VISARALAPLGALVVASLAAVPLAAARPAATHRRAKPSVRCTRHHHRCQPAKSKAKRHRAKPPVAPREVSTTTTTSTTVASTTPAAPPALAPATPTAPPSPGPSTVTTSTTTSSSAVVPARVQITAREYSYTLSRPSVPAGPVILEFVNAGEDPHNLNAVPAAGGDAVGAFGLTQPGTHADEQFTFPAGTYTLFCSLPGHAAMGMMATLTVN